MNERESASPVDAVASEADLEDLRHKTVRCRSRCEGRVNAWCSVAGRVLRRTKARLHPDKLRRARTSPVQPSMTRISPR